jgi:hypothetical protein
MGISARKQERDYMIGSTEAASQEARRSQAETNRNAAIEGMLTSAGGAIKSGAKSELFGGEDSFFGKKKKTDDFFTKDNDNDGIPDYLQI